MHRFIVFTAILFVGSPLTASADSVQEAAQAILEESGFSGGIIVHVGCGDGALTAALAGRENCIVQGLETDDAKVQLVRARIRSWGKYGAVSVTEWDGKRLPYADNLVNLILVAKADTQVSGVGCQVSAEEIRRVLAPGGVAIQLDPETRNLTPETTYRKPRPEDIDDWQHYLHSPNNNAVAKDSVVGPPQHMQWVAGPTYARSHEINSSMAAMVSSGGRLFYIWDEGPTAMPDQRFPPQWSLIARDAFNGTTLWKYPMPDWGWQQWHDISRWDNPNERAKMLRHLPATLPRRLVAVDDRLYVTLGYEAPVSVLDAATGEVVQELGATEMADEILFADGVLFLRVRTPDSPPDRDVWDVMPAKQVGLVMAVDAQSGRKLWESQAEAMAPLTLAVCGGRVFYANYEQVVCLDRTSGRELWRGAKVGDKQGHRGVGGTLVAHGDVVLYANTPTTGGNYFGQLHSFSAAMGELLWTGPTFAGPGVANAPDLFVVDDLVWVGETRLPVDNMETELRRQGLDLTTGQVVREVVVPKLTSPGHHYRCYRSKATERYLLLPKRGVEFVDLSERDHMRNDWLRAPCIYGMLPANGLLYVAPHQCVCYPGVLMANFNALAAGTSEPLHSPTPEERLRRGPAFDWSSLPSPAASRSSSDWPVYRHDVLRSGSTNTSVPDDLAEQWKIQFDGPLTPPVVAGGKLLVAEKDAHTVHAVDVTTGQRRWSYTAGGRVDSPPTIYGPLVLFGSADGWVYCLRLADGREAWRFLAAPYDRRIAAFGQFESVWPVHGSVLVQQDTTVDPPRDVVYCTAGRSSFLDEGIRVYGLDPVTGEMLHQNYLSGPRPDPFTETGGAGYMDGAKSDLLVSDGADLFLYHERFRSDLVRFPEPMQNLSKESGGFRLFPEFPARGSSGRRLITSSGFLDDNYNEGAYWTYSERWAGWDRKMRTVPVFGHLLAFDETSIYGMQANYESIRVRRGMTLGDKGYLLFGRDHDAKQARWTGFVPLRVRAMVLAGEKLFIAGPPDVIPQDDPLAAVEGRLGAPLWAMSAADGKKLAEVAHLDAPPVFDGLIAAQGRLFVCTTDGQVLCLGK